MVRETSVCYSHNILSAISPSCTRASTDDSRCFYPVVNNTVPLHTSEKITTWRYKSIWSFHWDYNTTYSRVPIRRHGTFIRHTPFIRPNTFSKKWAVPFNWISMSKWSTFRYKFVSINLHLLYRPRHMWLIFRPIHFSSCVPLRLFRTPLLIGTREYLISSS